MPYRPSLRSIWTLVLLAVVCYGLYFWAESSRVDHRQPYFETKMKAARQMDAALRELVDYRGDSEQSETFGDPRLDMLIGQQFSVITTDVGTFEAKVAGANPNFAALLVDFLTKSGVRKGSKVAIGFTGSNPGVNLAVLCACDAIGAEPVTITSVGSTWWGANDPDFTWLDMERLLNDWKLVHSNPIAASLGGGLDDATGLSILGRNLLRTAIERNHLTLISEQSVTQSSARRHQLFAEQLASGEKYAAYVNVGLGVASLGHSENADLIRNGVIRRLPVRNYPARGLIHVMNAEGVPIINLTDMLRLSRDYDLGGAMIPLPEVGGNDVFVSKRYDLRTAAIALAIALLLILLILRLDSKLFRLKESGVDPESLL